MTVDDDMDFLLDDDDYQDWLEEDLDLDEQDDEPDDWADELRMYESLRRGG